MPSEHTKYADIIQQFIVSINLAPHPSSVMFILLANDGTNFGTKSVQKSIFLRKIGCKSVSFTAFVI